ncbi:hypothetical protein Tco_0152871 [Tanacetum coccineum]
MNQFAATFSSIPGIVDAYLANKMHESVKTAIQLQSDKLRDEAQAENEDFINKLDDNIKKIIKDQVKEQVKAQVSKILLKIEKTVNEQLEAEVLTRSSNEYKTSHAVASNLSELELKKILKDNITPRNVDYAYLLWEDFVYQVDNKNVKRSNEMYYPRFTKVIVNFFMSKDQSIPRRNKLHGAILPNELTNESIKDSESYKEYYTIASGVEPPKTKASVKKKQARSDKAPKAPKGKRLKATAKLPRQQISSNEDDDAENKNDDDDDDVDESRLMMVIDLIFPIMKKKDKEEDSFDPRVQTPSHVESTDDEDSDEEIQGANVEGEELDEEETNEEDEVNELYRDVNVNLEGRDNEMIDAPRTIIQTTQVIEDTHVIITPVNPEGQQQSSSVSSGFVSNMLNPSPDTGIDSIFNLNTELTSLVDVPVTTIAEPRDDLDWQQDSSLTRTHSSHHTSATNTSSHTSNYSNLLPTRSSQLCIVDAYLANKMHEAVKTAVQLQSDRLRDEAQAENEDFINKLDDNIKKIIKDQVKEQVKAQVSKILPKIEKTVNEQLEAEVLTRSSNESKTSHAVAANLSELELKKILIDKMESNKSIHRSDEQKNLYKALVDAYESDKLILDTYGDTVSFKRRRDDEDKDKEPSAGSNQGSKRRRAGKEPESTSAPKEKTSKTTGKSTEGSKSHHKSAQTEEPMHTAKDLEEPAHQEFVTGDTEDKPDEETSQHPDWFQKPAKPPTPDRDWNKTLPAAHGPVQPWLSTLAQKEDTRDSMI